MASISHISPVYSLIEKKKNINFDEIYLHLLDNNYTNESLNNKVLQNKDKIIDLMNKCMKVYNYMIDNQIERKLDENISNKKLILFQDFLNNNKKYKNIYKKYYEKNETNDDSEFDDKEYVFVLGHFLDIISKTIKNMKLQEIFNMYNNFSNYFTYTFEFQLSTYGLSATTFSHSIKTQIKYFLRLIMFVIIENFLLENNISYSKYIDFETLKFKHTDDLFDKLTSHYGKEKVKNILNKIKNLNKIKSLLKKIILANGLKNIKCYTTDYFLEFFQSNDL